LFHQPLSAITRNANQRFKDWKEEGKIAAIDRSPPLLFLSFDLVASLPRCKNKQLTSQLLRQRLLLQ
jgi:hypothetical protein